MSLTTMLELLNYGLVLFFGLFLSTDIAGSWKTPKQRRLIFALCPVFLLVQSGSWLLWGTETVERLYPLIIHLPLVLLLMLVLKKSFPLSLVSVCTAYLCCQLPRWVKLLFLAITDSSLMGELFYTLSIIPIFFLLRRFFVRTAHHAIAYSGQTLFLFGSLPFAYYIFDYTTTIYSDVLYDGIHLISEFLPTALIFFYVLFLTAYYAQGQKRVQAELQQSMLEAELRQSGTEIENLRHAETQAAIHQHDMRHHMAMIESFLTTGNSQQAEAYIHKVRSDLDEITPKRFCENETANLLISSFCGKADRLEVRLRVDVKLPQTLSISDTEFCALLSNGLENALRATSTLDDPRRWVELYCGIRLNKLLIEIRNPYEGNVSLQDGLPVSQRPGHGLGCLSIHTITRQHNGLCSFDPTGGLFTLRVALPLSTQN